MFILPHSKNANIFLKCKLSLTEQEAHFLGNLSEKKEGTHNQKKKTHYSAWCVFIGYKAYNHVAILPFSATRLTLELVTDTAREHQICHGFCILNVL